MSSVILFLILYGIAILIGKIFKIKNISIIMNFSVYLLILFLSLWAGREITSFSAVFHILFLSIFYSILIIIVTYLIGFIIPFKITKNYSVSSIIRNYNFSNFSYLFILIIGWVIGYLFEFNIEYSLLIDVLLYLLAFVAGLSIGETINLNLIKNSLGIGLKIIFVVILSDIISSVILYFLSIRPYSLSLSICLGSGWYTYTGSIIASYYGSYYGTLAFLINFFREQFTFILVPILFRVYPNPISIIAIGGATSMDTTLGLYSLVLGPANSISALISGVLLTAIIPIVIPLAIYLVPM